MKTLLTKKELAERLRVHPCTIDNHVKAGTIHPRRLSPRKYLYVWEEVARDFGLN
jgi:predicted site-specific integrase-resolvase